MPSRPQATSDTQLIPYIYAYMRTMNLLTQPKIRKEAIEKLYGFLQNQGRFSILILGLRGTGKSFWLNNLITTQKKELTCAQKVIERHAALINDYSKGEWTKLFKSAHNGVLVINDVEKLSHYSQELLFECISTGEGGLYGFDKKEYMVRIVFTSSVDIKLLRENNRMLLNRFFDRISQLVVEFPSFHQSSRNVWSDLESVWQHLQFPTESKPGNELKNWLSENAESLHGNFRDLEKIAINYRNLQMHIKSEKIIVSNVIADFKNFTHFPEHETIESRSFEIRDDMDYYKDILPGIRKFVKDYALRRYDGKLKRAPAEKPFGVPYRTMERW